MTRDEIEAFEKIFGKMQGVHTEIGAMAKKSPNDGINKFKLRLVNATLTAANTVLANGYLPFDDFQQFDEDDLPTNSDVTFVVGQYLEELERLRADNIKNLHGRWVYILPDGEPTIFTAPPKKLTGTK
jgi:hypothetical protein